MGIVPSIMIGGLLNGGVLPAAAVASEAEAPLPPAAGERLADAACPGSSGIARGGGPDRGGDARGAAAVRLSMKFELYGETFIAIL